MLLFFFFNDTATTEIYTLSLHDALPIWRSALDPDRVQSEGNQQRVQSRVSVLPRTRRRLTRRRKGRDRKSTRLNSSHGYISYAVFCLKTKKLPIDGAPFLARPSSGRQQI